MINHKNSNGLDNKNHSALRLVTQMKQCCCLLKVIFLYLLIGDASAVVLLDESAVFEIIDHSTLLSWLQSRFSVDGTALRWFKSYLIDPCNVSILIQPYQDSCVVFLKVQSLVLHYFHSKQLHSMVSYLDTIL